MELKEETIDREDPLGVRQSAARSHEMPRSRLKCLIEGAVQAYPATPPGPVFPF